MKNTVRVEFETNWVKQAHAFIRLTTAFDQNNVSGFETATPGFSLLSAGINGEVTLFGNPLNISITGTNLTDKVYIDHLSRLKSEGLPNIGRNLSIGLNYKI